MRVFLHPETSSIGPVSSRVEALLNQEADLGVCSTHYVQHLQTVAQSAKVGLLSYLLKAVQDGRTVVGYGAAAKGNTLLNYAGVSPDLLPFVVDRSPSKQGKLLPGSRIPVVGEQILSERKPDGVLILPWNLEREIRHQLSYARSWGAEFVTAVPQLSVVS